MVPEVSVCSTSNPMLEGMKASQKQPKAETVARFAANVQVLQAVVINLVLP